MSDISAIDKALNAAKSKKATKAAASGELPASTENSADGATATPAPASAKRAKMSDEDKKARDEKRAADRAERKVKRDAERAQKKAEKAAAKTTPHMSKVEKAAAKLSPLDSAAKDVVNSITSNFSGAAISAIAEHLQHFNRSKATERALAQKLNVGDSVTIVSGDPKLVGKTGTVTKAQRIRCYVAIPGQTKDAYFYTSDVEVTASAPAVKKAS